MGRYDVVSVVSETPLSLSINTVEWCGGSTANDSGYSDAWKASRRHLVRSRVLIIGCSPRLFLVSAGVGGRCSDEGHFAINRGYLVLPKQRGCFLNLLEMIPSQ